MLHSFSFGELALIFGIIIVLFGGSRLASIGKSLGEGISNFKKGLNTNGASEEKLQKNSDDFSHEPKLHVVPNAQIESLKNSGRMEHIVDVETKSTHK